VLDENFDKNGFSRALQNQPVLVNCNLIVRKELMSFLSILIFLFLKFPSVFAQDPLMNGVVKDENGEPLIGVNIVEKGTTNGTVTDLDGQFEIKVDAGTTVLFSYIGYESKEVIWEGENPVEVVLSTESELLDEVVIIGAYGSAQKRSDMVGSAYQVDADKLEFLPAGRIDNLLEGLVPGLQIMPNTDAASSTKQRMNLRVRGEGSMSASNEPLWIVDGSRFYTGDRTNMISGINTSVSPLSYLNPDDIESITVLKDASATSIYGADGANGVILITTKGGQMNDGKAKVNLSVRSGISQINESSRFKVLDADQYMMLAWEAYENSGRDPELFPFQDNELNAFNKTDTRWVDVFYGKGKTTDANLSVSGGNENLKYYISTAYYNDQSTIIGNDQNRFALRSNLDLKMSEKLNLVLHYTSSYNRNNIFNPGNDYYQFLPIYSPYNSDGTFRLYNQIIEGADAMGNPQWQTNRFLNSVAVREENDDFQTSLLSNVNATLRYDVWEGLTFSSQFGLDYQDVNEERYSARTNWSGISSGEPVGYSRRGNSNIFSWSLVERLNYNQSFGKHRFSGILGTELRARESKTLGADGANFINDRIKEVSYSVDRRGSSGRNSHRSVSFLLQAGYDFDRKYFITINGRRDGNSGFGSDAQWGNFGSVGGSWNLHNEDFFHSAVIDVLKIKGSFGSNGNSRIGSQEALGIYSYSESDNYGGELGGSMSGSPNKKLSWETAYMTNAGIRIRLLDRLDIDVEAYRKKTVNLLSNLDVSRTSGDTRSYRNSGEIVNSGIEANIEFDIFKEKEYFWNVELNTAYNKNRLIKLYNEIEKVMGNYIWREQQDLNTLYLIRWAGVDPRDGAPLWYDTRGNVTRTYNADDRVAWKSSSPILTGGFRSSFAYKDFSVSGLFTYVVGGHAFSSFGRNVMSDGLNIMRENQSINQLDRWQKPGDIVTSPKPIWGTSTRSVMNSTRYVFKTTHVRFKNVSINYNLPVGEYLGSAISSVQLSLIGDNLFVWSPYQKKDMNTYIQSMSGYPMETTVHLGLNLTFN